MSSLTVNKLLIEPTVTADSGVWGGTGGLNGTITSLDLMLGGVDPISLSDVTYTLNSTEIQNLGVKCSGALTADVIVYSSCVGFYYVENNCTGPHAVTWQANFGSGGVGTGYAIPQGTRAWFVSDTVAGARPCPPWSLSTVIAALAAYVTTDGSGNFTFPDNLSVGGALTVTGALDFLAGLTLTELSTPSAPSAGTMQLYGYAGDFLASQTPGGVQRIYGKDPTARSFTSGSGTATPSAGVVRWRVRMGGGGSGGTGVSTGGQSAASAAGTTSLGTWTAIGGSGSTPGSGGTNGTGTLIYRQSGQSGQAGGQGSGGATSVGGNGGGTPFGPGAQGGAAGQGTGSGASGNNATCPGSGGGGAATSGYEAGPGGGSGEYVEFYISNPVALSYAVGAGSSGGISYVNGGAGANGCLIIEEFYS